MEVATIWVASTSARIAVAQAFLPVPPDTLRLHLATRFNTYLPTSTLCTREEARSSGQNCFTGAVLLCRKMLMNIAVQQGAAEGLKFIEYVNFIAEKGYVPPNGKHWVDHIRKKGNEATHEIAVMGEQDAKELISFIEMLLRFIYEFPSMVPVST